MMVDTLLGHLDGVRNTARNRWIACCPAHADKRPSLSIREIDGDRVLVHCWAGCSIEEVLAAVGLTFEALYPPRAVGHQVQRERRPHNAADILACIAFESLVASVAAGNLAKGIALTDVDRERLVLAASRLQAAAEAVHA